MIWSETPLPGLMLVRPEPVADARGSCARLYDREEFARHGAAFVPLQVSVSVNLRRGTLRGMHYQAAPAEERKLVRCIRGRVWDVAVDLRRESPTFLEWTAQELSPENGLMLVIPERCAHGFQVLEPDSELLYLHTAFYEPAAEGGIAPSDPAVGIAWPRPVADLSERDLSHPYLPADYSGIAA